VQHGPTGQYVYVVRPDQTAARQDVALIRDDGHVAVIARGLDEGQIVVTDGQSRLTSGSRIAISDSERRPAASSVQAGG
jgi:multidrug efflux system membrane fusion protein